MHLKLIGTIGLIAVLGQILAGFDPLSIDNASATQTETRQIMADPRLKKQSFLGASKRLKTETNLPPASHKTMEAAKSDLLIPSFGVTLGLVNSEQDGIELWRRSLDRVDGFRSALRLRLYEVARAGDRTVLGVVVGPFDSASLAERLCASLSLREIKCGVSEFRGFTPRAAIGPPIGAGPGGR
ncbi:hypothetical protein FHS85_004285 [Rhodoligotrophos appendicifer]|uniref:SPOR domain-containing protein n=1 Tax=Rhodoligotrophos appendicifer TaxID=987056 RepID=UPI0014782D72|nr:SPOR domain-containing protein [Rhodoligotrophos appendicifer]